MSCRNASFAWMSGLVVSLLLVACMPVQPAQSPSVQTPPPTQLHVLNWQGYGSDEPWAIELF